AKVKLNPLLPEEPVPAPAPEPGPPASLGPQCRCFCAGPVRPIGARDPITNERITTYGRIPLFGRDGFTEYMLGKMTDPYSCRANNGGWCEGWESYHHVGSSQSYATGNLYAC